MREEHFNFYLIPGACMLHRIQSKTIDKCEPFAWLEHDDGLEGKYAVLETLGKGKLIWL